MGCGRARSYQVTPFAPKPVFCVVGAGPGARQVLCKAHDQPGNFGVTTFGAGVQKPSSLENSESGRQAPRPRTLTYVKGLSERLSRKAVGLARSTYRRLQLAQTTADPDAEMRVWLRTYAATKRPCQNSKGAGRAALRPAP